MVEGVGVNLDEWYGSDYCTCRTIAVWREASEEEIGWTGDWCRSRFRRVGWVGTCVSGNRISMVSGSRACIWWVERRDRESGEQMWLATHARACACLMSLYWLCSMVCHRYQSEAVEYRLTSGFWVVLVDILNGTDGAEAELRKKSSLCKWNFETIPDALDFGSFLSSISRDLGMLVFDDKSRIYLIQPWNVKIVDSKVYFVNDHFETVHVTLDFVRFRCSTPKSEHIEGPRYAVAVTRRISLIRPWTARNTDSKPHFDDDFILFACRTVVQVYV